MTPLHFPRWRHCQHYLRCGDEQMKYPGRPERIWFALTGILCLFALGCMAVGFFFNFEQILGVGLWLAAGGVCSASLPLALLFIVMIAEKLRSK